MSKAHWGKVIDSRGDTIVEVLLAIAVVSSVLMVGFTSSNKSLSSARLSQERTEALKLVEAQAEKLRSLANDATVNIFDTSNGTVFCVDETPARHNFGVSTVPPVNSDNLTYPGPCEGISSFYNLSVQYQPASNHLFTIRARWDGPTGTPQEVTILYRIYQPAPPPPAAPPPPTPSCVLNPATINIPEVFSGGSALSESHLYYFRRLTFSHNIASDTVGLANGCRFRIYITTRDPEHPSSGDQPNERLFARFHLEGGGSIDTPLFTRDLPAADTSIESDVGVLTFARRPIRVEFIHYSQRAPFDTSSPNSVDPQAIEFVAE